KSIAFLGDSIIASTVYDIVEAIGKKIEFKNIIRKARSGARWNNTAETTYDISNTGPAYNNTIWNQLNILASDINSNRHIAPDIIFISAGRNNAGVTIGDIDETFTGSILDREPNTILNLCDSIRFNVEFARSLFPNAIVILATPIQTAGVDLTPNANAIKACADRLSVKTINQFTESGIYRYDEINNPVFLYDGTHPNQLGADKIGLFLANELYSMIGI